MELREAIEYAITGNALLFCGSGFSVGAVGINEKGLPTGNGLCNILKTRLNVEEIESDDDIEYYATKFRKQFGDNELIRLLKSNFMVGKYKEYHKTVSNIDWRRIYTTNYDEIIEMSCDKYKRITATLSSDPRKNTTHKELVVHLNGSIGNLTPEKLDNEFKLTMSSYSSTEFIESDWYEIFKNDIESVKAIFFVGFSLKYDLDIRRAITSRKGIRDKCFFIESNNISAKNEDILSNFGKVIKIGVSGFADKISEVEHSYVIPEGYKEPLYAFYEFSKDEPQYRRVQDKDITNLLFRGEFSNELLAHNSNNNKYVFKRDAVDCVMKLINEGKRFIVLESDFGNGKSLTLNILEYELNKLGYVFKLVNCNEDINKDISIIIDNYRGAKFFILDNYHNYFNVLDILDKYNLSECVVILSERSYINDTLYSDLLHLSQPNEKNTSIISLNRLSNIEIENIIKLFNRYNLWGNKTKLNQGAKSRYIKKNCKRSLKDVLIETFDSPIIKDKLNNILEIISTDKKSERIIIMAIISKLVNLDLNIDDYLYFLSMTDLSLKIKKDDKINELVDINENNIKVKSSILAHLIIKNSNFSDKIVDMLINIMKKLDKKRSTNKYINVQFALISFSNIQLLIKENGDKFNNLVIRYYESIKNTEYCNGNVFFWIQYANARISLKQFREAKLCLEKAKAEMNINRAYPQYDTCYSRYLLENQLFFDIKENAYEVFEEAHNGIYNNKNSKDRWHFPLKQTNLYYDYYKKFYNYFTDIEKSMFILKCNEAYNKIKDYIEARNQIDGKTNHRVNLAKNKLELILKEYISYEEVAATINIKKK